MAFAIVDLPTMAPAKCASCGSPYSQDGRKYIDTHIHIDRYGRIYICTLCFDAIARELGYQSAETIHAQNDILIARAQKITELEDENARLRSALASLDFLGAVDSGANSLESQVELAYGILQRIYPDVVAAEGRTAEHSGRAIEESSVHLAEGKRDTARGESGSAESSEGSGSDGVSTALKIDLH